MPLDAGLSTTFAEFPPLEAGKHERREER